MATLKGQNVRILTYDADAEKLTVFGLATSCTVTLTNNTESGTTKDDVGLADKPETVSRAGSVQVESLNVVDAAAFLTAVRTFKEFVLMWDETSTTDNQTIVNTPGSFARKATAICNDLTLNFNNREFSAKSVQFQLTSAPETTSQWHPDQTVLPAGSKTRGQFVRLFLSDSSSAAPTDVIAGAQQLSLHVTVALESISTKDTSGNWDVQEATGLSYDISTTALVRAADTIISQVGGKTVDNIESLHESGTPVKWKIANSSGPNQRTASTTIASGSAIVTQLTINAANRQTATYDAQLTGYGDYTVGA
jgi:hypothetical protein